MTRALRFVLLLATLALAVALWHWHTPGAQPEPPVQPPPVASEAPAQAPAPARPRAQLDLTTASSASAAHAESGAASVAARPEGQSSAEALPLWSPAVAEAQMRALEHAEECRWLAGTVVASIARQRELREWRWLPARQVAAERAGAEAALARLTQSCTEDDRRTPDAARAAADASTLRAAAQAGHLRARLRLLMSSGGQLTAIQRGSLRELLYDVLRSGDLALYLQIARYQSALYPPQQLTLAGLDQPRHEAWTLATCDLGLDCRAGSPMLDRYCLIDSAAACASPDLDTALHATSAPWAWRRIQRDRARLVDRLRRGDIQGLFDLRARPGGP